MSDINSVEPNNQNAETKENTNNISLDINSIDLNEFNAKKSWIKTLLYSLFVITVCFASSVVYQNKVVGNSSYGLKVGESKISKESYNYFIDYYEDKDSALVFIVDTIILANLAESEGISVSEEEISSIEHEYLQKEIALSQKVQYQRVEKMDSVTEDDLKIFFNENKEYFVKKGTLDFAAIQSNNLITDVNEIDTSKITLNKENISTLIENGFLQQDLQEGNLYLLESNKDLNDFKYFYFMNKNVTEYYSYEEVKDTIYEQYDILYGISALKQYVSNVEETIFIEEI